MCNVKLKVYVACSLFRNVILNNIEAIVICDPYQNLQNTTSKLCPTHVCLLGLMKGFFSSKGAHFVAHFARIFHLPSTPEIMFPPKSQVLVQVPPLPRSKLISSCVKE